MSLIVSFILINPCYLYLPQLDVSCNAVFSVHNRTFISITSTNLLVPQAIQTSYYIHSLISLGITTANILSSWNIITTDPLFFTLAMASPSALRSSRTDRQFSYLQDWSSLFCIKLKSLVFYVLSYWLQGIFYVCCFQAVVLICCICLWCI